MSAQAASGVRRLPLHDKHADKGARFGAFGGWEVPLYYTSILEEHEAVRRRAGLFDISHMGEFFAAGKRAVEFLDALLPRNIAAMADGRALYMPLLREDGGIVDDIIVYRFAKDLFLLIVNASNEEKDFRFMSRRVPAGAAFRNATEEKGLLALQGPASVRILARAFGKLPVLSAKYYHFQPWQSGMIARTGYTGEDGFEIMADQKELPQIWDALFAAGKSEGLAPAGFGARDTLRIEAGMVLYGHDITEETTPLQAGLGWAVDFTKPAFTGREKLLAEKTGGVKRKLVGFEMIERGIPRGDYEIAKAGSVIGKVTSGSFSPTLQKNIGMGYVPAEEAAPGNEIEILIRAKALKGRIVKLPFYQRNK